MLPAVTAAINLVFLVLLGIIGYFLKQYIAQLVEHIRICNTKHIDIAQLQTKIEGMSNLFTVQFRNLSDQIDQLRPANSHDYRKGHQ